MSQLLARLYEFKSRLLRLLSPGVVTPDCDTSRIAREVNMEKCRRVAVCDNSLNMAGITASLKAETTLEVLCINPDSPDAWQSLDENGFAAIIFDLSDPPLRLDVTLLRDRPGLLLIGVDPSRDEMLMLSSHPEQVRSVADLVKVIYQKDSNIKNLKVGSHEKNYQQ